MEPTITVKGTGQVSVKPDQIAITFNLESTDFDYSHTMQLAADAVEKLAQAIETTGMDRSDLKTTSFTIDTSYESFQDERNNYQQRFAGYICRQDLRLEFDYNTELLANILTAVAKADADPGIHIDFTVKDQEAVKQDLLIAATKNARAKAEILAQAAGVELGRLVKIDYNWTELHMYSQTHYAKDSRVMLAAESSPEINPADIELKDAVTFVWEINH